jgi:hypothetical protein
MLTDKNTYENLAAVAGSLTPEDRQILAVAIGDLTRTYANEHTHTREAQIGARRWLRDSGYAE